MQPTRASQYCTDLSMYFVNKLCDETSEMASRQSIGNWKMNLKADAARQWHQHREAEDDIARKLIKLQSGNMYDLSRHMLHRFATQQASYDLANRNVQSVLVHTRMMEDTYRQRAPAASPPPVPVLQEQPGSVGTPLLLLLSSLHRFDTSSWSLWNLRQQWPSRSVKVGKRTRRNQDEQGSRRTTCRC